VFVGVYQSLTPREIAALAFEGSERQLTAADRCWFTATGKEMPFRWKLPPSGLGPASPPERRSPAQRIALDVLTPKRPAA
jgi:hypothetical protein